VNAMNAAKPAASPRGRPRDPSLDHKVMKTALKLARKHGVRAVTLERIAEASGVARTTIYRRWRNRSAILGDAFLAQVESSIQFPECASPGERLRQQMHLIAALFRGNGGQLLRVLLAEALTDAELQQAIRERWLMPRRASATVVVEEAIAAGELPPHTSPDVLLDALYGGLYYWFLFDPAMLTDSYVDAVFALISGHAGMLSR
jgi:AcrR family transcriptional regulator